MVLGSGGKKSGKGGAGPEVERPNPELVQYCHNITDVVRSMLVRLAARKLVDAIEGGA